MRRIGHPRSILNIEGAACALFLMKKAVILINPYLNSEEEFYAPKRIREELNRLGVRADIRENRDIVGIAQGEVADSLSGEYDFCVYLDKDKYAARMLEKRGMRLFNRGEAIELCDDKLLTHIALSGHGVPMPRTVPAPLRYKSEGKAALFGQSLGYPVVVKECYGSLGRQVYLAKGEEELLSLMEEIGLKPYLLQEFIEESAGRDIRVICIGGEVAACMLRRSETDFRSNLGLGGRGEPYSADGEIKALCGKVSKILGLDYCGIDLLFGKQGYLLCEVNSNAFFRGIEQVTGLNIARKYAEYLVEKTG